MKHVRVGLALFWQSDHWSLRSAAHAVTLPEAEPRALREQFVVPSIGSRDVACAQRSRVRHGEDALQSLDFGNGLIGVHPSQYLREGAERST